MAGPLLRRLAGEAAPTLESLSWVRESGQPGKKDQRTLTKQPTCKLMERKRKLLQVLRECTAVGRQAVVCGAGARLASPLASVYPLWEEPLEVLGFPARIREVDARHVEGVPISGIEMKSI